jgi:alpha-glucosidase
MNRNASTAPWWQETTIYQVYPRSFMDSNGDGIGDLPGIISRLDYIRDLGFETIWVSPFYMSPQQDFGYDVSDYRAISPEYGTMAEAEELIAEVHHRKMRIIFDMIFCHTSVEHPWFRESRQGRDNRYSDWYIWRSGSRSGLRSAPPTNWKSITGVNGWRYEPARQQWFYTNFLPFQPDLNYRHPPVREAMFDTVGYWLDKGVDGFRLDIFHAVFKDRMFRNNPFSWRIGQPVDSNDGANQKKKYTMNLPENLEFAGTLRAFTDRWSPLRVLIGEVFGPHETIRNYLGTERRPGLHAIFLFQMLRFTFRATFFRHILRTFEDRYPAPLMPTLVLGNHDQRRWISRIGGDHRKARCISLVQLTARGIPVVYNGEEIGMEDGDFPFTGARDPVARQYSWVPRWVARLMGLYLNRDGCRTPMQWRNDPGGGFTAGRPWLGLHENLPRINVETQQDDPGSLLNHYRFLLGLRRRHQALATGTLTLLEGAGVPRHLLAYIRSSRGTDGETTAFLVVINFGRKRIVWDCPAGFSRPEYCTSLAVDVAGTRVVLPAATGVILSNEEGTVCPET